MRVLWAKYQVEGPSGLVKKKNIKADYEFKVQVLHDIRENHLTLVDSSLKYNVSTRQIYSWCKIIRTNYFKKVLDKYYDGKPDERTLAMLKYNMKKSGALSATYCVRICSVFCI